MYMDRVVTANLLNLININYTFRSTLHFMCDILCPIIALLHFGAPIASLVLHRSLAPEFRCLASVLTDFLLMRRKIDTVPGVQIGG